VRLGLRLFLLVALASSAIPLLAGQETADIVPSVRFPAEWYADNQIMATMPPVTGAPYEARVVQSNLLGRISVEQAPMQMRDSAGRTRTERGMGPRTAKDRSQIEVREVGVHDPVSQCGFQWEEPWVIQGTPIATVQCQKKKTQYVGEAMWFSSAYMKVGEEHPSPDETDETEVIGERSFDGVRAVGFRRIRVIKNPHPEQSQTIESEVWSSSQMKEIFAIYVKDASGYSIELHDIKLREPDAKLFYPPAGYKIEPPTSHP
jgi:hypothetical protein